MKKGKWTCMMAGLICAVLIMGACGKKEVAETVTPTPEPQVEETPTPTPEPTPTDVPVITPEAEPEEPIPEGMVKSILTGEYVPEDIGKKRSVAFMVDNVEGAFPHHGNASASVYYEAPVEGNLTRECIVFEDLGELPRISSLRSSRDYFISYTVGGFNSIYCHYGQAAYALPYLEDDRVNNISGLASYGGNFFYRVSDLANPHDAATSAELIEDAIEYLEYERNMPEEFDASFHFLWVGQEADMTDGEDAHYVGTGYPIGSSYFTYNEESGLYDRFQYGAPEIDGSDGSQIQIKNVILEFQDNTWYQDSPYQHFDTTGSGRGKYITNGKAIDITWEREDFYSPVRYYRMDGSELLMNCGKTWVSIIKNHQVDQCVFGPSYEEAHCVVSDEEAAEIVARGEAYSADYKEHEAEHRHVLDMHLAELYEKHGGISKVSPIYNQN